LNSAKAGSKSLANGLLVVAILITLLAFLGGLVMLIIWIAQCPSRWFYTAVTILAWFTWVRDGGRRSKLDRDLDRIDIDV